MSPATSVPLQDYVELQALIHRTAALLDAEDLDGWLALFDEAGEYRLSAFSTELNKTLVWWQADVDALRKTLAEVRDHVRDPARRLRVVMASPLEVVGNEAHCLSSFSVYRSSPAGESSLYVVGRYRDVFVRREGGAWRYRSHQVELDTRMLDMFTHLPL
jgi:3-phenylpropionate/cinnamic acid dioxygenase small subunit